jgi:RNA polymerase sigma-70 factor (ECF subfamily)
MRHPYLSDDPKRSDEIRNDCDRLLVSSQVRRTSASTDGRDLNQGSGKDVVKSGSTNQKEFSPSDAELVKRVQTGSKEDFQILVERYQQRAFAVAFQILKRYDDAQDVVQESFVKAYLSIDSFHGTSSFFTWFYRIVVNMAIDFRRKAGRKEKETISLDVEERDAIEQHIAGSLVSQPDSPLEVTLRGEQARQINQVLGEISEDHRLSSFCARLRGCAMSR